MSVQLLAAQFEWEQAEVWTASWARVRTLPKELVRVVVTQRVPDWCREFTRIDDLMPGEDLIRQARAGGTRYDWRAAFRHQLERSVCDDTFCRLPHESVIVCYDKIWESSARRLVFEHLARRFGVVGGEWPEHSEPQQQLL